MLVSYQVFEGVHVNFFLLPALNFPTCGTSPRHFTTNDFLRTILIISGNDIALMLLQFINILQLNKSLMSAQRTMWWFL